jgi:L-asparaginase
LPRVRLLATGGTIASRSGAGGRTPQLTAAELLSTVGPLPGGVDVEPLDVVSTPGFAMTLDNLQELARSVEAAFEDGIDGIVVTHGTDTMEESAFYLALVHHDRRPVVFTGAQRPADSPAPDGPANLEAALRAAGSDAATGCGVLLVFDGIAWPARGVRKVDTLSTAAFAAPGHGPVLHITDQHIYRVATPHLPADLDLDPATPLVRVDVVPLYLGADDVLLRASVAAGARGVVLAALGAGNASPSVTAAVAGVVAGGAPVLICSRVPSGPVEALYGGGGGADLAAAGALFGADLTPWQGRLLLSAVLAAGVDPADVLARWSV